MWVLILFITFVPQVFCANLPPGIYGNKLVRPYSWPGRGKEVIEEGEPFWDFTLQNYHGQSPVNLPICNRNNTSSCKHVVYPENPLLLSFIDNPNIKYTLQNSGHGVEIVVPDQEELIRGNAIRPILSGGILPGRYLFKNMHFHWGNTTTEGSEHSFNGKFYPFEIHIVMYKESYRTYENAIKYKDGLVVLTVFGKIVNEEDIIEEQLHPGQRQGDSYYSYIQRLVDHIPEASRPNTKTTVFSDALLWFTLELRRWEKISYYAYPGGLTTPLYSEIVTFILLEKPICLTHQQLEVFRNIQNDHGSKLSSNRRPIRFSTEGRPIIYVPDNYATQPIYMRDNLYGPPGFYYWLLPRRQSLYGR